MANHDQSDYRGLGQLHEELLEAEAASTALEQRWLELAELVG